MVGKIKLVFTPQVIDFLDDLVRILYKKEYFGFIETAEEYVSKIYDAVPEIIKSSSHKLTPKSIKYLGSSYVFYNSNNQIIMIIGIINNHCEEAKDL